MCLKISVIVIPKYLHKAFDIRESPQHEMLFTMFCFCMLCYLLQAWKALRFFPIGIAFCKMYAIWVINERFELNIPFRFDSFAILESTQNGSPFVIRDVFMCSRLENHMNVVLLLSFQNAVISFFLISCFFKKQFDTRKKIFMFNVYSSWSGRQKRNFLSPIFSVFCCGKDSNDVVQCNYFFNLFADKLLNIHSDEYLSKRNKSCLENVYVRLEIL